FPVLLHREFAAGTMPWATAALAAPLHFFLVYDVIRTAYPIGMLGLVPAVFAVPSLVGLIVLLKRKPPESPALSAQLALFGGAALFFITLIFPIQFDRQWITLGWALEGAALCWLFHRVPHPALRLVGTALLVTAFVRLALNPAVLSYHARSATPIINWYLYTYGIVTICLFAAARLQPAGRSGAHIPIFRQLRARHELQHRLGAVRVAAPDYWDPSNGQAGAICESGITRRYRPQAFPARSFATGSALSNRCIRRRRN